MFREDRAPIPEKKNKKEEWGGENKKEEWGGVSVIRCKYERIIRRFLTN